MRTRAFVVIARIGNGALISAIVLEERGRIRVRLIGHITPFIVTIPLQKANLIDCLCSAKLSVARGFESGL